MSSNTQTADDDGGLDGDIQSIADLILADYETIELAMVKLTQDGPREIRGGRIIARDATGGLRLRRNGHTYAVPNPGEWALERYKPVTTSAERMAIEAEWGDQ